MVQFQEETRTEGLEWNGHVTMKGIWDTTDVFNHVYFSKIFTTKNFTLCVYVAPQIKLSPFKMPRNQKLKW